MFQNILIKVLDTADGYGMHVAQCYGGIPQCYGVFPKFRGIPQQKVRNLPKRKNLPSLLRTLAKFLHFYFALEDLSKFAMILRHRSYKRILCMIELISIKPSSHIAVTCRRLPPALLLRYAAGSLFLM